MWRNEQNKKRKISSSTKHQLYFSTSYLPFINSSIKLLYTFHGKICMIQAQKKGLSLFTIIMHIKSQPKKYFCIT